MKSPFNAKTTALIASMSPRLQMHVIAAALVFTRRKEARAYFTAAQWRERNGYLKRERARNRADARAEAAGEATR